MTPSFPAAQHRQDDARLPTHVLPLVAALVNPGLAGWGQDVHPPALDDQAGGVAVLGRLRQIAMGDCAARVTRLLAARERTCPQQTSRASCRSRMARPLGYRYQAWSSTAGMAN